MKPSNIFRSWGASLVRSLAFAAAGLGLGATPLSASTGETPMICEARAESAARNRLDVDAGAMILVANSDIEHPQWRRTVLLATPMPNGGHVGVIINRPTQVTLEQLFPGHEPSRKILDPVYYGGPFFVNVLVAVVRSGHASEPGSLALTRDLVLATAVDTIDRIIEREPASARYYMGFVLWRPGELNAELGERLWSVCTANAETVFRPHVEQLWEELSAIARGTLVSTPLPAHALAQESTKFWSAPR